MDEGQGRPNGEVGEPFEVPALRVAAGAASVFGAADGSTDAGVRWKK
jgi:hypothetical protein